MGEAAGVTPERYVLPLSAESAGNAPGRGRLNGRRILIVGGGQRIFDAATDPIGNGRAMSILCAREGAHVAVHTVSRIAEEGGRAFTIADAGGGCRVDRVVRTGIAA